MIIYNYSGLLNCCLRITRAVKGALPSSPSRPPKIMLDEKSAILYRLSTKELEDLILPIS